MDKAQKKQIVVILGLRGSGKSFASKPYTGMGYTTVSFADPLRTIAFKSLGYVETPNFNYDDFKKSTLYAKKGMFKKVKLNTGRQLLQQTGSVIKELFGKEVWADAWQKTVLLLDSNVVNDDCRFDYEVEKALKLIRKGYEVNFVWSCYDGNDYTEAMNDTHESEALAQFIYRNQDKYGIHDLSVIGHKLMKQILADFKESKQLLQ